MESTNKTLFTLTPNLYQEGSPVIITAGCIQKNTETEDLSARLEFRSIANETVSAVRVMIEPSDKSGRKLAPVEYVYDGLSVSRDDLFGTETGIPVPDDARSIYVRIGEVIFYDGSGWKSSGEKCHKLKTQRLSIDVLRDAELDNQYRLLYGKKAVYWHERDRDLILCVCGEINRADEHFCNRCLIPLPISEIDVSALTAAKEERLKREKEQAESEAEESFIASEISKMKRRTAWITALAAALLIAGAAVLLSFKVFTPMSRYSDAVTLMNSGEYDRAYEEFTLLGDYRDSPDRAGESLYRKAVSLKDGGKPAEAAEIFSSIPEYRDSADRILDCMQDRYDAAKALLNSGDYESAGQEFLLLGDFGDAREMVSESEYRTAATHFNDGEYEKALLMFDELKNYRDSSSRAREAKYNYAKDLFGQKDYDKAFRLFGELGAYSDSADMALRSRYRIAAALLDNADYDGSYAIFEELGDYGDAGDMARESLYRKALSLYGDGNYDASNELFIALDGYKDSGELIHTHVYTETAVTKEPTCAEEGEYVYTCTVCGATYTEAIPRTAHTYVYTSSPVYATCTETGTNVFTCSVCGDVFTQTVPMIPHSYSASVHDATCTEEGLITYTCTVCGDTYTETTGKLGHDYTSELVRPATCTADGLLTYTCTRCGDQYNEPVAATGHKPTRATRTQPSVCTECGIELAPALTE